jgi:hypothetical protein
MIRPGNMLDNSPAVAFWVPTRHTGSDREVRDGTGEGRLAVTLNIAWVPVS